MSKLAELFIIAIVPLLVGLYSAPLDAVSDEETTTAAEPESKAGNGLAEVEPPQSDSHRT